MDYGYYWGDYFSESVCDGDFGGKYCVEEGMAVGQGGVLYGQEWGGFYTF